MGRVDVGEMSPGRLGGRGGTIVAGLAGAVLVGLLVVVAMSAGTGARNQAGADAARVVELDGGIDATPESLDGRLDVTPLRDGELNHSDDGDEAAADPGAADRSTEANSDDDSTSTADAGIESEVTDSSRDEANEEESDTTGDGEAATGPSTLVEALSVVDYSCPDGARLELIADDAVCHYTETQTVDAIAHTIFHCPSHAVSIHDDASGDVTGCSRDAGAKTVPAIEKVQYQCPPGTGPVPTPQQTCARTVEGTGKVEAIVTIELSCPDGYALADDECREWVIHPSADSVQEVIYSDCPDGSEEYDAYSCVEYGIVTITTSAQVIDTVQCPTGSKPVGLQCKDVATGEQVEGRIVVGFTCTHLEGAYGEPTVTDPTCLQDVTDVTGVFEKPREVIWHCPEGTLLDPHEVYRCVGQEGYVYSPPLETVVYSCPPGSAGAPSADDPTCPTPTIDTTEYVPVDIVATYRCPLGSTGNPTTENPTCSELSPNYEKVEPIETTSYACPDGTTGNPTASSPNCQATEGTSGAALATTTYSCPAGSIGTPTSLDPTCTRERE